MDALAESIERREGTTGVEANRTSPRSTMAPTTERLEQIDPDDVDPMFIERVPIAFARRFLILGLRPRDGIMPVAIADPHAMHALDKVTTLLGLPTEPVEVEAELLRAAINRAYGERDPGMENVISGLRPESPDELIDALARSSDLLDSGGASPVTRLVNLILLQAVQRRASDVHLQPYEDRLQVRLRIDGVLYDYVQPPRHLQEEIVSRIKVMGGMNIAEKRLPQDGRSTVQVGDKSVDLRISSLPTRSGERIVLRLLDRSARLYRLTELGMARRDLTVFRELIRQTHGIILVTGPTGSGKSTTLYAALQELNAQELNILTLEDPIEYQLPGVSQSQVSDKKGMTFATGLRTVLRQDPDVIMVGEIRDQETARMAIQSSLTGHLVFSTLHTNDAAGAVARLLDLGIEPYLVASSLLGVVAQRLVRCLCPFCRVEQGLGESEVRLFHLDAKKINRPIFAAGRCRHCHETGHHDRTGIYELLRVNDELHDLIAAHPRLRSVREAARRGGMRTLREDAVAKLLNGVTSVDEVLRVTHEDEVQTEN